MLKNHGVVPGPVTLFLLSSHQKFEIYQWVEEYMTRTRIQHQAKFDQWTYISITVIAKVQFLNQQHELHENHPAPMKHVLSIRINLQIRNSCWTALLSPPENGFPHVTSFPRLKALWKMGPGSLKYEVRSIFISHIYIYIIHYTVFIIYPWNWTWTPQVV